MKVDQDRLAQSLSLSQSTVSRSLSGHPAIHPETRARVLAAARDLGYEVRENNRGRRALPAKLATVGVLVFSPAFGSGRRPETGQEMLVGLSDAAAARDTILDTHFIDAELTARFANLSSRPAGWRNRTWRGAILVYQHQPAMVSLLARDVPVVSLVHQYDDPDLDCIDTDSNHGMRLLVTRLASAGHRRVGFFSRTYRDIHPSSWVILRFAGFVQALARNGLPFLPEAAINVPPGPVIAKEDLIDEALRVRREHRVTAFVCGNDEQAQILVRGLLARGIRVPEDISVTGFDGVASYPNMPQLTTIRSPFRDMGVAAFRRLANRIQEPIQPILQISRHGTLISGATIAPPSATP